MQSAKNEKLNKQQVLYSAIPDDHDKMMHSSTSWPGGQRLAVVRRLYLQTIVGVIGKARAAQQHAFKLSRFVPFSVVVTFVFNIKGSTNTHVLILGGKLHTLRFRRRG